MIAVLGCILVPATALCQVSQSSSQNSEAKFKLIGMVINSVTGEPVRRALVQVQTGSERSALTDSDGHFEIDDLAPGQAGLNVRKPGFLDAGESDHLQGMPAMTTIGPDSESVVLKLVPESVLYGQVQNTDGQPLEHLPVQVIAANIREGRKVWEAKGAASTNDEGEFRIANLPAGSYYLETGPAAGINGRRPLNRARLGYPALLYPGAPDLGSATPFELNPGQQLNADVVVKPVPVFKVEGTISGLAQGQNAGVQFVDQLGNQASSSTEFDSATGHFRAEIAAGAYTLEVNAWGTEGISSTAELPLTVTSDVSGVTLGLHQPRSIPIIFTRETTRQPATHRSGRDSVPVPFIRLIRVGDSFHSFEYGSNTVNNRDSRSYASDPSLAFFLDVAPGKYLMEVNSNDAWYVHSAQSGAADLLREELTVTAGVQISPIEVVLRDDGAILNGEINLGRSSVRSTVQSTILLVPDTGSTGHVKSVITQGNFSIPNLAPGGYSVLAFENAQQLEYTNANVLDRYMSRALHVTLQPNEQHQITLDLINATN